MCRAGYQLTAAGPNGVTYARSYYSGWATAGMILLFPLGLVLLAFKSSSEVTMVVAPNDSGCQVHVAGEAPKNVMSALAAATGAGT